MLKIIDLAEAPSTPMEAGRGLKTKLVDSGIGAQALDLHLNKLAPGGPRGKLHKHSVSENVYIVRAGEGELTVEDQTYRIKKDQVVFIPAGVRHSLSNVSEASFEVFEIYAPAGGKFDFIICE